MPKTLNILPKWRNFANLVTLNVTMYKATRVFQRHGMSWTLHCLGSSRVYIFGNVKISITTLANFVCNWANFC